MSRAQELRENAFNKLELEEKVEAQKKITLKQNLFTTVGKPTIDKTAKKYYDWALTLLEAATYSHARIKEDITVVFSQYLIDRIQVSVSPIGDNQIFLEYINAFNVTKGSTKERFIIEAFYIMKAMFDNEEGYCVDISKVKINNGPPLYNPLGISFSWHVTVTMHCIE